MNKIILEFIDACAWCDIYRGLVETLVEKHRDIFQLKIYKVGKDMGYIPKYGMIMKSTLVIDGKIKITNLSEKNIKEQLEKFIGEY